MLKEKFIYNEKTLSYEKIQVSFAQRVRQSAIFCTALALYTALIVWVAPQQSSAKEKAYLKELTELRKRFHDVNDQLENMSLALQNIHERDAAVYRQVLDMEPTDEAIWNGGRGGNDKYADLRNLSDAELLIATTQKISKLRHQIAVSAESQDQIISKASKQQDQLQAIPSIRPIRHIEKDIKQMSGFGYRIHPVFKIAKMHTGIDFGAPTGTPIYATGNGTVIRIENKPTGYGKNVVIDHGYGYQTLYAHMSNYACKVGQKVVKGEQIGYVGSTGTSTAPHVHYEVIYKDQKVNPLPFCTDGLTPEEYRLLVQEASRDGQYFEK
jgi:murein DD-endopeptidase MepM/ murein hydrolase activator NlpD